MPVHFPPNGPLGLGLGKCRELFLPAEPPSVVQPLQIVTKVKLQRMRLVSLRQEAHHRGYRIEGVKQGEGILLRVTPTRPDLPTLRYSRFRTLRSTWLKAVGVVAGYIDESLDDTALRFGLMRNKAEAKIADVRPTESGI
jgi:hypothetical protein